MHKIKQTPSIHICNSAYNQTFIFCSSRRQDGIWLDSIIFQASGREFSHLLVGISGQPLPCTKIEFIQKKKSIVVKEANVFRKLLTVITMHRFALQNWSFANLWKAANSTLTIFSIDNVLGKKPSFFSLFFLSKTQAFAYPILSRQLICNEQN